MAEPQGNQGLETDESMLQHYSMGAAQHLGASNIGDF
jgi:hypothetical protein